MCNRVWWIVKISKDPCQLMVEIGLSNSEYLGG